MQGTKAALGCRIDPVQASYTPPPMLTRVTVGLLLGTVCGYGQAETAATTRLKAEFKETFHYTPPAPGAEEEAAPSDEPVLELEPMIITRSLEGDILAEARRAAEAKRAKEFSLRHGGTLLAFPRGEIGFWPKLVPVKETPVKKGEVMLSVDLLRIKW